MTETVSSVITSEVRATSANIKQQNAVNMKFVDEQIKRIRHDYRKHEDAEIDNRDIARLILADLQAHDVDDALVNEFKRLYVGG